MNDITEKIKTLRIAKAQAVFRVGDIKTMQIIHDNLVPKGNIFEFAKVAAMFAAKKTSEIIPDCHPLPIESFNIEYEITNLEIKIMVEIKTIYRTGVEVEAMHSASVAALTMYDMLKPIDKNISISTIQLIEKKGGKSNFSDLPKKDFTAAVIVCSDTISAGKKEDKSGKFIVEKLKKYGIENIEYSIIADEKKEIELTLKNSISNNTDLIIYSGGTGLSPRDITPDVIRPLLEREVSGIMEAARVYGQERMPYAMISRGVAGYIGNTLVLTFPGSFGGTKETMAALFPYVFHLFKVAAGARHE